MNKEQALEKYKKQISENDRLGLGAEALSRLDDPFNKLWIGGLVSENYTLESQLSLASEIITKLEKAVEFYGRKENWQSECINIDEDVEWIPNDKNSADLWENADQHGGKLARATLSEVSELKKKMKKDV